MFQRHLLLGRMPQLCVSNFLMPLFGDNQHAKKGGVLAPLLKMTLFPSVLGLAGPLGPRRRTLGFPAQNDCSVRA